jgi:hypothetical protein
MAIKRKKSIMKMMNLWNLSPANTMLQTTFRLYLIETLKELNLEWRSNNRKQIKKKEGNTKKMEQK